MKGLWRGLHRWLAWSTALLLLPWVLSGCLLLWRDTVIPSVRPRPSPASLDRILAAAQTVFPPESGDWYLRLPRRADRPARIRYVATDPFSGPETPVTIIVDPYRATVLAVVEGRGAPWDHFYAFHTSLGLPGGRGVLWALTAALGGILASGLATGWHGRSRHARLGRQAAPALAVSLLSGIALLLPTSEGEDGAAALPTPVKRPVSLEQATAAVEKRFPGLTVREIQWTADATRPWRFALHCAGTPDVPPAWVRVWVDPRDGRPLKVAESRMHAASLKRWAYQIHTGAIAGTPGRALLTWGALGLTAAACLGLWKRRRHRRRHGAPTVQNPA